MATILIVDNSLYARTALTAVLSTGGHQVIAASADGEEALQVVAQLRPDLVVVDLNLPGIHGIDLLACLNELAPTPAIATAPLWSTRSLRACRKLGVPTLAKPVQADALLTTIATLVGADRAATDPQLQHAARIGGTRARSSIRAS